MKKELNVIEVPASGKTTWGGGAYCVVFLYTKHKGNLVLKGYMKEIEEYIKQNYTHYFANYTLWNNGIHRSIWKFWANGYYISEPRRKKNHQSPYEKPRKTCYKWVLTSFSSGEKYRMEFRRFPKRWVKEFDKLTNLY